MTTEYERHEARRRYLDKEDGPHKRTSWTVGNLVTTAAATIAACVAATGVFAHFTMADANANAVPQLRTDLTTTQQTVNTLSGDVANLKERRGEDVEAVRGMRTEIIGRLDRIEGKLDQKADKPEPGMRGWTRQ